MSSQDKYVLKTKSTSECLIYNYKLKTKSNQKHISIKLS